MATKYPTFDRSQLHMRPLAERAHDMDLGFVLQLDEGPEFDHPDLPTVASRVSAAMERGASRILMTGAHAIKQGASRHIIDLIRRGVLTHVAINGAGVLESLTAISRQVIQALNRA